MYSNCTFRIVLKQFHIYERRLGHTHRCVSHETNFLHSKVFEELIMRPLRRSRIPKPQDAMGAPMIDLVLLTAINENSEPFN